MDYGRSRIQFSPHFSVIMEKYRQFGRAMPATIFHRDYIKTIDSSITLRSWQKFEKKLKEGMLEAVKKQTTTLENLAVKESALEDAANKKVLAIANFTLDAIVNDPSLLESIPVKQRMTWLFQAMKARDSRANIALKKRGDDRKQNIFETLMEGAQYGAVEADEIIEVEDNKKTNEVVEFSPENL